MKFVNLLFVFILGLIESIALKINGSRIPSHPSVPVVSDTPVPAEIPVSSPGFRLTPAQQLMSGLATLRVNEQRIRPVQTATARQAALSEAAERRRRRALRRQGLHVPV